MAQTIHLMKLCVGADSIDDLTDWQRRMRPHWPAGVAIHVTRMWPKREADVLDGGSLYWVIKGLILCRQQIVALEQVVGDDGISRCAIHLDLDVVRTEATPRRAFQGWRYLDPSDAPRDLPKARKGEDPLPPGLAEAMATFGLR